MLDYSLLYPMTTPTRCSMKLDGMWKFSLDWQEEGENFHIPSSFIEHLVGEVIG